MSPVEIAVSQLGVGRGRSREDDARIIDYLGGDPAELHLDYCAALVLWVFKTFGDPLPGNFWRNRAVHHLQRSLEDAGLLVAHPAPGDIFVMSRERNDDRSSRILEPGSRGHAGIVRDFEVKGPGFRSVEGNVGGGRVLSLKHFSPHPAVRAFYRPHSLRSVL